MNLNQKQLSNPFSTGSGGASFEHAIQAKFVTLMLTGGYAPCLPPWPIKEIKLQGKIAGYHTDDVIITVENPSNSNDSRRLLGQIKHSISITENSNIFEEVIQSAWDDFNDNDIFTKGKDVIGLITGPISKTDVDGVSFILEQARHTQDFTEFSRQVDQTKFSSNNARSKRDAFRSQLEKANGSNISDNDFFEFLKHFHLLGYDLDKKGSVVSSLIQSHIAQFDKQLPYEIWCKIIVEVQQFNQSAGTITLDTLSEDIRKHFETPKLVYLPEHLASVTNLAKPSVQPTNWANHKSAEQLAFANLVGSWNEKNDADKQAVSTIVGEDYDTWISELRNTLSIHDTPFSYKNGLWVIKDRKKLWSDLGARVFDDHLERFRKVILDILQFNDPAFDLPKDKRYMASVYNKYLPHSDNLRHGVAETLALLGCKFDSLSNCSDGKAENIANTTVHSLFQSSDWLRWGSLNSLLPTLAEASPKYFLQAVEVAIDIDPSPFDALFEQETTATFGQNYLTGLLWALENIAWEEIYLTRVSVVLAEIASHDPGGNWANRPINSLTNIFLPWHPQTLASVEKRQVAIKTVCREQPDIGWNLVESLLPNQYSHTFGTHKPKWRDIVPDDWEPQIFSDEFLKQNLFFAELLVEMADCNVDRLTILVGKFDLLVQPAFDKLKEMLISKECLSLPEEQRTPLWNKLVKFIARHRQHPDAEWAINESLLVSLDEAAKELAPKNTKLRNKRLFLDNDFELYENAGDWDIERDKLYQKRQQAIIEILTQDSLQGVLDFAWGVSNTSVIGEILAKINEGSFDSQLLPNFLDKADVKKWNLIVSYSYTKLRIYGWQWFDSLDKALWAKNEIAILLSIMPFEKDAWDRVNKILDNEENLYWENTNASTFDTEDDIEPAIKKLLEVKRSHVALQSIRSYLYRKREINMDLVCDVLLELSTTENLQRNYTSYDVTEIIKVLQENPLTDQNKLFQVEWAYLSLLDNHSEVSPITLENSLADDPDFFCQILRFIYRSEKTNEEDTSQVSQFVASNAYRLLSNWQTVPGTTTDLAFDSVIFNEWLEAVEKTTLDSDHYDVAMIHIGKVLFYAPQCDDLWIHPEIAQILNQKNNQKMRDGYRTALYNSRGAHWVDPEAKPEKALAEKYYQQAEDVENAGYHRLATTLRDLAEGYESEAERIINSDRLDF
ncbi:hypothetical protein [Psychrobacter okhotskensis]|uniref:hypothetical protein n=1 Tax=Psychrobacter okhotskensis TaxID=212403 RepID=UPI001919A5DA|nr:hypothetical protein [Psychrobacter okhotskensis]